MLSGRERSRCKAPFHFPERRGGTGGEAARSWPRSCCFSFLFPVSMRCQLPSLLIRSGCSIHRQRPSGRDRDLWGLPLCDPSQAAPSRCSRVGVRCRALRDMGTSLRFFRRWELGDLGVGHTGTHWGRRVPPTCPPHPITLRKPFSNSLSEAKKLQGRPSDGDVGRDSDEGAEQSSNGDMGQGSGGDAEQGSDGTQDQAPGGLRDRMSPEGDLCRAG